MNTKQTTLQQDLGSLAADLVTAGNHEGAALVTAAVNAMAAPQQPVAASSEPVTLTDEFIAAVILNVCEIPDRNSPDDEPEAMVCTPDELTNCIRRAEEEFDELDKPIFAGQASTNQPAQAQALTDDDLDGEAITLCDDLTRANLDGVWPPPNWSDRAIKIIDGFLSRKGREAVLQREIDGLLASQSSAPADVAAVRDGFALVPLDATSCMVQAADSVNWHNADTEATIHNVWSAMVQAYLSGATTAQPQADGMKP